MRLLVFSIIGLVSFASNADVQVPYEGFYDQLKVAEKEEYTKVKTGFFLVNTENGQHCTLDSVLIASDQRTETVAIGKDNEIMLPFDKELDQDKAKITLHYSESQQCNISVQPMAREDYKNHITLAELKEVDKQLFALLQDSAGFWGKRFLPEFKGVTLLLDKETGNARITSSEATYPVINGRLSLSRETLENPGNNELVLPGNITRIQPWLGG